MACIKRRPNRKTRQIVLKFESSQRRRNEGSARSEKSSSVGEVSQSIATSVIKLKPRKKKQPFKILSLVDYNDTTKTSKFAQPQDDPSSVKRRSSYKKNMYDPPEAVLRPGLQFGPPLLINRSQQSWLRDESEDISTVESWIGDDSTSSGQRYKYTKAFVVAAIMTGVIFAFAIAFTLAFSNENEISAIMTAPLDQRHSPAKPLLAVPPVFHKSRLPHTKKTTEYSDNDDLRNIIKEITSEHLLEDADTPQGKAFRWIQSYKLDGMDFARLKQRYILAVLYFQFEAETWNVEYGWLSSKHECTWHGVRCGSDATSSSTDRKLSSADENLAESVTYLNLSENNLHGKLPEDLKYLTNLAQLILSKNFIQGTIPPGLFSNFQSMHTLYLDENYITGQVPDDLGHLLLLRNLYLHDNSLRGTIPAGINFLTNLVDVRLQNNEFYGNIQDEFDSMTNLRIFLAGNNELEGTVPASLADCPLLEVLQLQENMLDGSIPGFLSSELRQLHLDNNGLEGSIPLLATPALEELRLENNKLSGEILGALDDLTNLTILKLQGNELTGSVPDSVCLLKEEHKLTHLTAACVDSVGEISCDCCDFC